MDELCNKFQPYHEIPMATYVETWELVTIKQPDS